MRAWGLAIGAVLLGAAMLPAAPLDVKEVAENAQWLAHVDGDAMRQSTVVQKVFAAAQEQGRQLPPQAAQAFAALKIDPAKDIQGVTLYGSKVGGREAVLLIHASVDREVLLEKVKQAPDYKAGKHGPHDIHTFKAPRNNRTAAAALLPDVVVIAENEELLGAALDVLDGKTPSLAKDSPLAAEVPKGTMVVARAVKLGEADVPFRSPLVQQSESVSVVLGENEGQVFADAKMVANSAEVAGKLKEVVDNIRTMAELRRGEDPDAKKLIDATTVDVADSTLKVKIDLSAEDTLAIIKKAAPAAARRFRSNRGQDTP